MTTSPRPLSRRTVLRGLGGAVLLPVLPSLTRRTAAAERKTSEPPRLACFYIPGGICRAGWFPKETGFDYTLSPAHEPLAHHRDRFSVLTGLSHIEGRISGHEHPLNWLTGQNVKITPGTVTNTVSMDQVAAAHLSGSATHGPTWLPSLVLSFSDGVGTRTLSRNAQGVDVPAIGTHRTAFERLFPPKDAKQAQAAKERLLLDRSILDAAVGDVASLRNRLGQSDRRRVDQYLDAVRDVERRIADRDRILSQGRPDFDEASLRLVPKAENSYTEQVELMMDLIALAFQTEATRVVTHSLGGEGGPNYDEYKTWAGEAGGRVRGAHDVHHKGSGGRSFDEPDVQVLFRRDRMLVACLARLMDKLQSIEAADGSLLDHTAILFGGSQDSSHSGGNFPTLLAGGNNLGFRHGQHLKFKGDHVPMSDLYLTILQQLGCPVESFKESKGTVSDVLA